MYLGTPLDTHIPTHRTQQLHDFYVRAFALTHDNWADEVEDPRGQNIGELSVRAVRRWLYHSAAAAYRIINVPNFRDNHALQEYALGIMSRMTSYEDGHTYVYSRFLLMVGDATNRVAWSGASARPSKRNIPAQIYVDWLEYDSPTIVKERTIDGAFHELRTFIVPEKFAPNRQSMIGA